MTGIILHDKQIDFGPSIQYNLSHMSAETRIIPIEASHARRVVVTRNTFFGEDFRGAPNVNVLGEEVFDSFEKAFQFAATEQTINHDFETDLSFPIRAELSGAPRSGNELLIVEIGRRRGVSPRSVKGHHGVSTDYDTFFHIIIKQVGSPSTFDRGLAWFDTTIYHKPKFKFTVLGHKTGWQSNLLPELEGMLGRTNDVLQDLFTGMNKR